MCIRDSIYHLASNPNRVFTRDQLLDEVWGFDYYGDSRTVAVSYTHLGKRVIANPGCYTTGAPLALAPAVANGLIELTGIIIDSKSGVTGAGRGLSQGTHYPDLNEGLHAYKAVSYTHLDGRNLRLRMAQQQPHQLRAGVAGGSDNSRMYHK